MNVVTVKTLYKACEKVIREGKGDRYIMISNDDEGNGYHELFDLFSDAEPMIDADYLLPYGVNKDELGKYIILG